MDNDLDFRDLLLEVETELTGIVEETMKELLLPQMKQALLIRWMTMPDELKEQVQAEYPETYNQIMRIVQQGRNYS